MQRIAVIGCGGSGKSHIARSLGASLGVPVTHLDAVCYDDEWNKLPPEKFAAVQEDLAAAPEWVIDGNYAGTMSIRLRAADTVVFLDLPARMCLRGIARRWVRQGGGGQHAGGVYNRITFDFVKYVWHYRRDMRPQVNTLLAEHAQHADVVVLTTRRQAGRWVAGAQR